MHVCFGGKSWTCENGVAKPCWCAAGIQNHEGKILPYS